LLGYQDNANYPLPWVGYWDRKWDKGRKEIKVQKGQRQGRIGMRKMFNVMEGEEGRRREMMIR
jgi:hypothetical protein